MKIQSLQHVGIQTSLDCWARLACACFILFPGFEARRWGSDRLSCSSRSSAGTNIDWWEDLHWGRIVVLCGTHLITEIRRLGKPFYAFARLPRSNEGNGREAGWGTLACRLVRFNQEPAVFMENVSSFHSDAIRSNIQRPFRQSSAPSRASRDVAVQDLDKELD